MSTLQAIILGVIQGITEFLPVSSSGHLMLGQYFLGLKHLDRYIGFNLICHLGTLLAVLAVFGFRIYGLIKSDPKKILMVIVGTLPLVPLVLLLKPLKAIFDKPQYLGFFFLLTALMLYGGMHWRFPRVKIKKGYGDALGIGMFQAMAVLPGVSRSGSTISAAKMLGWNPQEAIFFSLLLAIPAISGASFIEMLQLYISRDVVLHVSTMEYLYGFIFSFLSGLAALLLLVRLVIQNKLSAFIWYCSILGVSTLIYFNLG